mmetsp:Transcript_7643/g.13463  ORF Transcript_7643/g.13463 Transcript_7643/m.13463 type:complete len:1267 (+) Transcript_7643:118-3918(+)
MPAVPIHELPCQEKEAVLREAMSLLCEDATYNSPDAIQGDLTSTTASGDYIAISGSGHNSKRRKKTADKVYSNLVDEEDGWEDSLEMDDLIAKVVCVVQGSSDVFGSVTTSSTHIAEEPVQTVAAAPVPFIGADGKPHRHKRSQSALGGSSGASISSAAWSASRGSSSNANTHDDGAILNDPALWKELEETFKKRDQETTVQDRIIEFQIVEAFVLKEQNIGRERRREARTLERSEEKRLASEVAQLKGLRLQSSRQREEDDLRWKISNAERAYMARKAVYAKAAQVAGSEMRLQFARVRDFLESLHQSRQQVLYKQHRRSINYQALMHTLKQTDPRVVSLDRQINTRLYRKQKSDLNEQHMTQTLEEAVYLDSMMNTLGNIQRVKEKAARELFNLHIVNLKEERENNERRNEELSLFAAAATLEMSNLVAHYIADDAEDQEEEAQTQQKVEATERSKDFHNTKQAHSAAIGQLFDTVVWGVTTNNFGLTTSGSSMYSSDFGSDFDDPIYDEDDGDGENSRISSQSNEIDNGDVMMELEDLAGDPEDDDDGVRAPTCSTPIGKMHSRKLARELRAREKAILKKHEQELKTERREYRKKCRALKAKHQEMINKVINDSVLERESLRESINERMEALRKRQDESTEQLKKRDMQLMREALFAEDQRIQEATSASFMKAQEHVSAQVFHEVRNALSSVIAMSDMANGLRNDKSLSPTQLVGSVDKMLEQISDVVDYSLMMLNDILDVSKINSGAFVPKNEPFDLKEVVSRATRMQQAKASHIHLSFRPAHRPCIALSDSSIVERTIATLISNAVKFTPNGGAVQPFIWPLENVERTFTNNSSDVVFGSISTSKAEALTGNKEIVSDASLSSTDVVEVQQVDQCSSALNLSNKRLKYVAVGVADTGIGLCEEKLDSSRSVISTSTSSSRKHGAQNTGFGLYHAHLQTRALKTKLQLASLEACRDLLDETIVDLIGKTKGSSQDSAGLRRTGTVLYFTLPVYEDCEGAYQALQVKTNAEVGARNDSSKSGYTFRPMPAPSSKDRYFRILVADDVLMLRKGMVHAIEKLWTVNFPNCPLQISTACSAEDVLRAVELEPFDLVICDHHFMLEKSKVDCILPEQNETGRRISGRPRLTIENKHRDSPQSCRHRIKHFFDNERFTVEDNDGSMLGLNALVHISESNTLTFPKPLLMLVSGHTFEIEPELGIIVALKPLKPSEFVGKLESCARDLRQARIVRINREGSHDSLLNSRGSQIFIRSEVKGKQRKGHMR